ncbi:hypothetical protein Nepgr_007826 [Nepenthes gracilis]|uniref:Uncharacterized protein n=1 Tax=Nepenthes gracilis TaxID=150966 RepID=A0AAD3XIW1_NEPGR|nr:hypothetical protein Nepgr_007826 [Nepenthes gracilis]
MDCYIAFWHFGGVIWEGLFLVEWLWTDCPALFRRTSRALRNLEYGLPRTWLACFIWSELFLLIFFRRAFSLFFGHRWSQLDESSSNADGNCVLHMEHPFSGDVMVSHDHPCTEQVPEYALGPLDASGHSAGLNPKMQSTHDGDDVLLHDYQAPMHSLLGYVDAPESPDQPDAKLNHNPVDDVDIELTPSSIKRISNKYSLESLNSSVECADGCRGASSGSQMLMLIQLDMLQVFDEYGNLETCICCSISDGIYEDSQESKLKDFSPFARRVAARINFLLRAVDKSVHNDEALHGLASSPTDNLNPWSQVSSLKHCWLWFAASRSSLDRCFGFGHATAVVCFLPEEGSCLYVKWPFALWLDRVGQEKLHGINATAAGSAVEAPTTTAAQQLHGVVSQQHPVTKPVQQEPTAENRTHQAK